MAFAPVNPFDRMMSSINKQEGFILGNEGSGIIIEVGSEVEPTYKGAKVSVNMGTWQRFVAKTPGKDILIFHDEEMRLENAAAAIVGPFTALNLFDVTSQQKH